MLMRDETSITEIPPLYACDGQIGAQVCVPITGTPARRGLHGGLNIHSGELLLLITGEWVQETPQAFLTRIRSHWRGWNIVLCEDRGAPHTADASRELAKDLHLEGRFLPLATPELNAMDHLWRQVKGRGLAHRSPPSIDASVDSACLDLLDRSHHERLHKAGGFSGNFWLTL
jgi:transposase